MSNPIKLVFADLCHSTKFIVNNYIPLNIAYLASYSKKHFKNEIDVYLYKSVTKLTHFIKNEKPEILAISNYLWNSNLSLSIANYYKQLVSSGIVIIGGPNFPIEDKQIIQWFSENHYIDFSVKDEGEQTIINIIERLFKYNLNISESKHEPINGCYFLSEDRDLVYSDQPFLNSLDIIPSPYLNGMLDNFLINDTDGFNLFPMFESTRGCPYSCTFCNNGDKRHSKVRFFSVDRFIEEVNYVYSILNKHKKLPPTILITDQNFGLYEKDVLIAKQLSKIYNKYNFPNHVIVTTGKGNADNVLKTIEAFSILNITLSVQSLDDEVLNNVKRRNFPLNKFKDYQKIVKKNSKMSASEIILGLPGDNKTKHLTTIRKLLLEDIDFINPFSFMMLKGTISESNEMREKYSYKTKFRLIPGAFSSINGIKLFEYEEIVVASDSMKFEDYLYLRNIHLLLVSIFNGVFFKELRKSLYENDIDYLFFLQKVINYIYNRKCSDVITRIVKEFCLKSKNEFFDSQLLLKKYYSNNFNQLINDEVGENLLQKFKFLLYSNMNEFIESLFQVFLQFELKNYFFDAFQSVTSILSAKAKCVKSLLDGMPVTKTEPYCFEIEYDIEKWIKSQTQPLYTLKFNKPQKYIGFFNDDVIDRFNLVFEHKQSNSESKGRFLHRLGDSLLMPNLSQIG